MDYYKEELNRAWDYFLGEVNKGVNIITAIGKVRGHYGEALSNSVQERIAKELKN
jgi:hypothetical protein